MSGKPVQILFLCTGNSARSILAEAVLNRIGAGRFRGHSAGSHPAGAVHPLAREVLREAGYDTTGLRSKSWDAFAAPGAPEIDIVITVCDAAAGEACPVWPGRPVTAHWGLADPVAVAGTPEKRRAAFRRALDDLEGRIRRLVGLPIGHLDRPVLERHLREIATRAADTRANR